MLAVKATAIGHDTIAAKKAALRPEVVSRAPERHHLAALRLAAVIGPLLH